MKPVPIRKRRMIEIYFVLYLAALILLLPGRENESDKNNGDANSNSLLPYSLQPEKTTLNCRLTYDSSGVKILSLDSVNTVFYKGDVEDVRFEFVVEDEALRQKLYLKSDSLTLTRNFRIQEIADRNAATFYWQPSLNERTNKTYLVHVFAEAKSKKNDKGDNQSTPLKLKTQFSLNIMFADRLTGLENGANPMPGTTIIGDPSQNPVSIAQLSEVFLEPSEKIVKTIAFEHWSNTVNIFGLNPKSDLKREPVIKIIHQPENNGGSAYIASFSTNMFELKGDAPQYGNLKVQLSVIRKWDNQQITTEFLVQPQPVKPPEYPKVVYPGIKYIINPNLPIISGQRTKALIKDGNNVRAVSHQGEEFAFTPVISDTGKIMTLELYINDNLFGEKHIIRVINYQDPEIVRLNTIENGVVHIQTRSYGEHNGKENFIGKLEIEGNAIYRELIGKSSSDNDKKVYLQTFRISRKFADKPFEFKVKAVDQRGKKSWSKIYPED